MKMQRQEVRTKQVRITVSEKEAKTLIKNLSGHKNAIVNRFQSLLSDALETHEEIFWE